MNVRALHYVLTLDYEGIVETYEPQFTFEFIFAEWKLPVGFAWNEQ